MLLAILYALECGYCFELNYLYWQLSFHFRMIYNALAFPVNPDFLMSAKPSKLRGHITYTD